MSTENILEFHEDDILEQVDIDEEDLPDAEDVVVSDVEDENMVSVQGEEEPSEIDDEFDEDEDIESDEPDDSTHIFSGHTGELYSVACSPTDETLVATGGGDNKVFVWKMDNSDWGLELQEGHEDSVSSLAFSADGSLLATGSLDGVIQVWNMPSGGLNCRFDDPEKGIEWVRWHPRQHLVLAGTEDGTVWLWCADRNVYLRTFFGHSKSVTCGDFTPDGNTICTGSEDASLRIWNRKTGKNMHVVKGHRYHTMGLTCMSLSSDSTLAITGSEDGSVCIVNIATGKVINSLFPHSDSVEFIGLSASSRLVATAGLDGALVISDLKYSSARCTCKHEGGITCLVWLGSSPYVVTGGVDGKLLVWDSLSGECVKTFSGHSDAILSLSLSANLYFLVSVSVDETARVFDIREFKSGIKGVSST